MEIGITILKELQEISPLVASIPAGNPYQVPPGYLEGFPMMMLLRIAAEEKGSADPVLTIGKDRLYEIPADYFDGLAANILNRIKAAETANAKEELDLISPVLGQLEKKIPFTAPEGYFSELSGNVVAGVQAIEFVNGELENLSAMMRSLKNIMVYEVPEGYFEQLPAAIMNNLRHQPAKVIGVSFSRKMMRYAAAAAVIGVIALGAWWKFQPAVRTGGEVVTADKEIKEKVKAVSDDEILNYANNNTVALADINVAAGSAIGEKDAKDLLADVSDEELQHYLEEHGGPANSITN